MWIIGVRYDDGSLATVQQSSSPGLRIGDRVRVGNNGIELLSPQVIDDLARPQARSITGQGANVKMIKACIVGARPDGICVTRQR